jgi:hypothetical protein
MIGGEKHFTVANIIAIILAIIGIVWLIYSIWRNWKVRAISSWPKTDAMVVNVAAQPANNNAGNVYIEPSNIIVTTGDNAQYIPRILYAYRVGGKEYQSNNLVYSGSDTYNAFQTKMMVGQLQPGSTIPIFYNPSNHSEAYVYNGQTNYWGILGGIILILIAAAIGYHHASKTKTTIKTDVYSPSLTDIDNASKRNVVVRKNTTTTTTGFRRDLY